MICLSEQLVEQIYNTLQYYADKMSYYDQNELTKPALTIIPHLEQEVKLQTPITLIDIPLSFMDTDIDEFGNQTDQQLIDWIEQQNLKTISEEQRDEN